MSAKKNKGGARQSEIRNAKARHNYEIGETFEAGIVLTGTEVKSVRANNAQIGEAFARIQKGELWLFNAHIGEYSFGNYQNHEPRRKRKLLLKRREIHKLQGAVEQGGKSIVPLRMYVAHGLVKVQIALATGKKRFDKRETLKRKIALREAERAMKR